MACFPPVRQLSSQADSIAKLCEAGTAQNGPEEEREKRAVIAAASLQSKLRSYVAALDGFSTTLDKANMLATLYCPAIKADDASARLG